MISEKTDESDYSEPPVSRQHFDIWQFHKSRRGGYDKKADFRISGFIRFCGATPITPASGAWLTNFTAKASAMKQSCVILYRSQKKR
jgi:hypothetical protein